MQEFQMIAKTFKGLEEVLAKELIDLGANNVEIGRRAVAFTGDRRMLYRANICLRTASRVLRPIAQFRAKDADDVYRLAKEIDWSAYMTADKTFAIDSTVYSETFRHSGYVTYRVKDAIADYFTEHEGRRPNVKVTSPDIYLNVHIAGEDVTVSLDASGESLHKRGWREATTEAPINEALAAGLLLMAGWKGDTDLYDPMCGSGTFLVEAAMIALGIAPGIYRDHFAFEHWLDFDEELFREELEDDSREREFSHHIYGADASFYCVRTAERNIKAASLSKYISVRQCRIQELTPEVEKCLVMLNPPYGERLKDQEQVMQLYKEMGTVLKHRFTGSTAWIISSNEDALKCIGLRPAQRIPVLNGELECHFNCYELFQGDNKEYKTALAEGRIERRQKSDYQHHTYASKNKKDRRSSDRKQSDRRPSGARRSFGRKDDKR